MTVEETALTAVANKADTPAKAPAKRGRKKAKVTKEEEPTEEDAEELERLRSRGMLTRCCTSSIPAHTAYLEIPISELSAYNLYDIHVYNKLKDVAWMSGWRVSVCLSFL